MIESIPNSILPHLNEISERLWSGHAAIMVGAGFSRNATPRVNPCKGFPDWNQLGDVFYEKTRGEKIKDGRFLNVLKLADEVQASFGRPMLHQLLRDSIPDTDYEPSSLHVDLLKLPWSDVLTTNYDTLLERAANLVTERSYNLVVNNQNLIYSERPRIIKLHGSFPSVEPFIITEEDYRRYPNDFAPFVNTVQQCLLENTLCLVGFSGDDPNFLRWIGWIRDNLGEKQSPKIYLIGVLNLTKAQVNLLVEYNIVTIDMSELEGVGGDHFKGVQKFLDFCASKNKESENLDWPNTVANLFPVLDEHETLTQKIEEILPFWKSQRESFPGWVVVPDDRRGGLFNFTRGWGGFVKKADEISKILLIEFLYEYCWRMEKCLCPISDETAELISVALNYIEKLYRDLDADSVECSREIEIPGLDIYKIKKQCAFLQLAYLRYLREEGRTDQWVLNEKRAYIFLGEDDSSQFYYEKCLFHLFEFDLEELEGEMRRWVVKPTQSFWSAKKAGLLAELGKFDESIALLKESLNAVRVRLNLKPITSDYSDVSQEAYILFLLNYVEKGKNTEELKFGPVTQAYNRLNFLKQYKCDPWGEWKIIEMALRTEFKEKTEVEIVPKFDLDSSVRVYHDGFRSEVLDAFKMLKFVEDIGAPIKISTVHFGQKAAMEAISRLREIVPYWSMSTMFRIGSVEAVDKIFNRKSMVSMRQVDVDPLVIAYCNTFKKVVLSNKFKDVPQRRLLKSFMPELLSRLLCKCSFSAKKEVFSILEKIYQSDEKNGYSGVRELTQRLLGALSEDEMFEYLLAFIKFPVIYSGSAKIAYEFPNPFEFIRISAGKSPRSRSMVSLKNSRVEELIGIVAGNPPGRKWAIYTLRGLKYLEILDVDQELDFRNAVWSLTDEQGLPENTGFYRFSWCDDFCPESVDGSLLIKNYIVREAIQIQNEFSGQDMKMTERVLPWCFEIIGASSFVRWTFEETNLIIDKILCFWGEVKKFLDQSRSGSIWSDFEGGSAKFTKLKQALIAVVPRGFNFNRKSRELLFLQMVDEMVGYGLPVFSIKCAFSHAIPAWRDNFIEEASLIYLDTDSAYIMDAIEGFNILIKGGVDDTELVEHFLNLLSGSLLVRDKNRLRFCLMEAQNLICNYEKYFSKKFESSVLFALDKIKNETDSFSEFFELHEGLCIREISARLAYCLDQHYKSINIRRPDVIDQWCAICDRSDEFVEIRNAWSSYSKFI